MKAYVNDQEINIFAGARVRNALLSYSWSEYRAVKEGEKLVKDECGNEVLLDGYISDGEKLYTVTRDEPDR